MIQALITALVGVAVVVSGARAQLSPGTHRVIITAPDGQFDSGDLPTNAIGHWQYSFVDAFGRLQEFTADASTSGGQRPQADVQAAVVGGFTFPPNAEAKIFYGYRVMPIAGSTRTAVPLIVRARGSVMLTPTGVVSVGSALAEARVVAPGVPGVLINELASAQVDTHGAILTGSFSVTRSTVVTVGVLGQVQIRAYGYGQTDVEFTATADPTFEIDPEATYEENGQVYRYADEFVIEYSEGIEQYIPCVSDLTGDGLLDVFDVLAYLDLFGAGDVGADLTGDGLLDVFDVFAFLDAFQAGCP